MGSPGPSCSRARLSTLLVLRGPTPLQGQLRAVWKHRLKDSEVRAIQAARVPCLVVHGRHDIVALPKHGARLARRLRAPFLLLEGAHFVFREEALAVNAALREVLHAGSAGVAAAAAPGPTVASRTPHLSWAAMLAVLKPWLPGRPGPGLTEPALHGRAPDESDASTVSDPGSRADSESSPCLRQRRPRQSAGGTPVKGEGPYVVAVLFGWHAWPTGTRRAGKPHPALAGEGCMVPC